MPPNKRDFLTLFDLTSADLKSLLHSAARLKRALANGQREALLPRRVIALLFEKPSLRTRVSFEAAICQLGGSSVYLGKDVGWGDRESVSDFANALSRYVDAIVFRGSDPQLCIDLAKYSRCPVINGLTRDDHPCQALADCLTIREHWGDCAGRRVAYIGDGNNVANSLAVACGILKMQLSMASPEGYHLQQSFVQKLRERFPDVQLECTTDPRQSVRGAHVVYTDVWVSMGDEAEREERRRIFAAYQVDGRLLSLADPRVIFLHCLPARRGEEVTDEVIDSPASAVFEQAENRLHMHKAILLWLLAAHPEPSHE